MIKKERLSASVDSDLLRAAERALPRGGNLSAWVNDALRLKLEHDRRLRAFDAFLSAYEANHGEITDEEMERAARRAQDRAIRVRAKRPSRAARARQSRG